jgi:hypothetical protein
MACHLMHWQAEGSRLGFLNNVSLVPGVVRPLGKPSFP